MKLFTFLVSMLISIVGFSQINSFNETTQLLNKPHGKPVLQIIAGVEYWHHDPGYEDVWAEIEVPCFVLKSALNNSTVEKGSLLFDFKGKIIGTVLFNTKCNTEPNTFGCYKSVPDSMHYIWLTGFIEKEKLSKNVNLSELMKNNIGYSDSCISISRVFTFYNTAGEEQKVQEDIRTFYTILKNDKTTKKVRVNEKRTTLTQFGADGDFKSMTVEIIQDYDTDHPQSFIISNEAYECVFDYDQILFTERNWSAGPDHRYQYSVNTFEPLMEFLGQVYKVQLPKSNITGFIGYYPGYLFGEESIPGTLTFTDGTQVLSKRKIICNNPDIASKIMWTNPIIEFNPKNNKDKVSQYDSLHFVINSKESCKTADCLTDFGIILHLTETGEDISLELEFRDGDVFIVKNYMDAFELE